MHFRFVDVMFVTFISRIPVNEVWYASKIINKFLNCDIIINELIK